MDIEDKNVDDPHNAILKENFEIERNSYCANFIILPQRSSWYGIWKSVVKVSMFYGYYNNFIHIGFTLGEADFDDKKIKEYI